MHLSDIFHVKVDAVQDQELIEKTIVYSDVIGSPEIVFYKNHTPEREFGKIIYDSKFELKTVSDAGYLFELLENNLHLSTAEGVRGYHGSVKYRLVITNELLGL
jgi:hypothetical protein